MSVTTLTSHGRQRLYANVYRGLLCFNSYATFGPLDTLPNVITGCNQLLRWIKQEETKVFVLDSPVFTM
jgi:hypothetical protein